MGNWVRCRVSDERRCRVRRGGVSRHYRATSACASLVGAPSGIARGRVCGGRIHRPRVMCAFETETQGIPISRVLAGIDEESLPFGAIPDAEGKIDFT